MENTWTILQENLPQALFDTFQVVSIATLIAIFLGGFLGFIIYLWSSTLFFKNRLLNSILGFVINAVRSLPFLILMIALIPVSAKIVGDPYTPMGGAISLTVAAIPFFARIAEGAFNEVDYGVLEAAISTGAGLPLIFKEVILPESLPGLIRGIVLTLVSVLGYSAMLGTIGAGGIGDLAIQYGYYRYEFGVLIAVIVILIVTVQLIQWIGDYFANKATKR